MTAGLHARRKEIATGRINGFSEFRHRLLLRFQVLLHHDLATWHPISYQFRLSVYHFFYQVSTSV
jgi:hypothetical protein